MADRREAQRRFNKATAGMRPVTENKEIKHQRRVHSAQEGDIPLPPMDAKPKPSLLGPYRRIIQTAQAGKKKLSGK